MLSLRPTQPVHPEGAHLLMAGRALIVSRESLSSSGGLARVVCYQRHILEAMGWCVETVTPDHILRPWRCGRYPALNTYLESILLSRLGHAQLRAKDAVFTHGLYLPHLRPIKRVHLYHATVKGLATACRRQLDSKEYFVIGQLGNLFEQVSGVGARRYAVSQLVQNESLQHHGYKDTQLLYNAIDVNHFVPGNCRQGHASGFVGLVVGRMDRGKGKLMVQELGSHLPAPYELRLACESLGDLRWPDNRAQCLGLVSYSHMPALYHSVDYVFCPSRYEGFGMSIVEAWACGKPVISTNTGIINELVNLEPAVRDLVVDDPDDAEAFAQKIRLLRENPEVGVRQARWGLQMVHERFTFQNLRRAYEGIVDSLALS